MNPIITEQLNKFKTGDFSGYESFYNETVNTVYTMLHTIANDQNVATSLVPQVYDKIYQNVTSLEQTEGFYQWAAGFVNEEALAYLKENGLAEIRHGSVGSNSTQVETADSQEETEPFYDYAVEDEALTITEAVVADTSFVTRLQEIVNTLSPIERIAFQDYYYFGISVPEIATKTGCKDADIRYSLRQTRTSVLQAITASPAYAADYGNTNVRRYRLAEAPWMWIAYQNFLGYTLGIDTVSIAGWSLSVLGQATGAGVVVGAEGVAGAMSGASAGGAAAAVGGASGASGIAAGILGTVGGKIALGVIGAALVTGIGFGVHHVVTERQTTTEIVTTTEATSETTTEATTEAASETTTEATTEATTEEVLDENVTDYASYDEVLADLKQQIEQYDSYSYSYEDTKFARKSLSRDGFYVIEDIDGDGTEELMIAYWNAMRGMMDIGDIFTMRNGKIVKIFTNKYGYGDNGQGAFLYSDGEQDSWKSLQESAYRSINLAPGEHGSSECTFDVDWKIENGEFKFVSAEGGYSSLDGTNFTNILIKEENAFQELLDAIDSDLSLAEVHEFVDSQPDKYEKIPEQQYYDPDAPENKPKNWYKGKWQPLYEDNQYLNTEYGPKPDADGKF